jgi:prepilin-type N-terminal cleavage/methylation domain-containing protein
MRDRRGFTLIELVLVMMVGAILASVAVTSFSAVQSRMGTRSAESQFLTMHAQTRALAVERGDIARLVVDQNTVTVLLGLGSGSETMRTVNFMDAYNVTIESPDLPLQLCMNPRGFGERAPCTSFDQTASLTFQRTGQTRSVRLLPLGQVLR